MQLSSARERIAALERLLGEDAAYAPPLASTAAADAPGSERGPAAAAESTKAPGFLVRAGYDFPSLVGRAVELRRADQPAGWQRALVVSFNADTQVLTLAPAQGGARFDVGADDVVHAGSLNVLL